MPVVPGDSGRDFPDERPDASSKTPHWIVEHGHPTEILGWLVGSSSDRHSPAIHDLTAEEFAGFWRFAGCVTRALHAVLGTEKEYVVQFAEATGHAHAHISTSSLASPIGRIRSRESACLLADAESSESVTEHGDYAACGAIERLHPRALISGNANELHVHQTRAQMHRKMIYRGNEPHAIAFLQFCAHDYRGVPSKSRCYCRCFLAWCPCIVLNRRSGQRTGQMLVSPHGLDLASSIILPFSMVAHFTALAVAPSGVASYVSHRILPPNRPFMPWRGWLPCDCFNRALICAKRRSTLPINLVTINLACDPCTFYSQAIQYTGSRSVTSRRSRGQCCAT